MSIVREKHADRFFTICLKLPKKVFEYAVKNDSLRYQQGLQDGKFRAAFNGKSVISDSIIKKCGLTHNRTQFTDEPLFL